MGAALARGGSAPAAPSAVAAADHSNAASVSWSPKAPFGKPPTLAEISRVLGKQWIEAAKDGNLGTMKAMISRDPLLLHFRATVGPARYHAGQGESLVSPHERGSVSHSLGLRSDTARHVMQRI